MKLLLSFLLSAAALAQNFSPDTIVYKDNTYAGKILEISDSRVRFDYPPDKIIVASIPQLTKIVAGKLGLVYYSGFLVDVDAINNYLANRTEVVNVQKPEDENNFYPAQMNENLSDTVYSESGIRNHKLNRKHRWSFGILLIPYYSGKIYSIEKIYTNPPPYYSSVAEPTVQYAVTYTAAYYENRSENHQRSGSYSYNSGNLNKEDLTLLDLNLGIKYYLNNIITEKVTVYLIAGFGKQFAFGEEKNETLFQQPPTGITYRDNSDKFLEDSNSPFHFNLGFGAEYFFNESLSLTSNIRFMYSKISAKYEESQIASYQTITNTIDYKKSDFLTRIGLGLNFYF
ncbi:MAG: outer membrane beta-barrel protein [Ignavibacteriaceae bacterium]